MLKFFLLIFLFSMQIVTTPILLPAGQNGIDSSYASAEVEKLQFDIKWLQLERMLSTKTNTSDSSFFNEIESLKKEALTYYHQTKYQFANLIIDEIQDILELQEVEKNSPTFSDLNEPAFKSDSPLSQKRALNFEFISGIDLWKQQFEMNLGYADTALSEGFNNPYIGLQLNFGQEDLANPPFQGNLVLKESRDYFSTSGNMQFSTRSDKTSLDLKNYIDGTFYKTDTYLSYFQNNFAIDWRFRPTLQHRWYIMGEFILRNYQHEEPFIASYFQNQFRGGYDFQFSGAAIGFGVRYLNRNYPHFVYKNYSRSRMDFSTEVSVGPKFHFSLRNEVSLKDYATTTPDSLYQSDYIENLSYMEFKYNLNHRLNLIINNTMQWQTYQNQLAYLRDNFGYKMELAANYTINAATSIKVGGLYELVQFQGVKNEDDIPPDVENYFAPGLIFSFDYFLFDRIILSLTDTYRWRRYPNAQSLDMLSIFSNRDNNSLFLLLNWQLGADYQLNIMANYDTERDREVEHSDSKNTMFSMELIKRF